MKEKEYVCRSCGGKYSSHFWERLLQGGKCKRCIEFDEWSLNNPIIPFTHLGPADGFQAFIASAPERESMSLFYLKWKLDVYATQKNVFFTLYLKTGERKDIFIKPDSSFMGSGGIKGTYIEGVEAVRKSFDDYSECGFFSAYVASQNAIRIYYMDISEIKAHWIQDYPEETVTAPIYGYKAVNCVDGELIAKDCKYEIGIAKEVDRIPAWDKCAFDDCYLHFCTRIETVLGHWNYGLSILSEKPTYKLYRVKAEGHAFQRNDHPDSWVASKLTIIDEVPYGEILDYYHSSDKLEKEYRKICKCIKDGLDWR